MPGLAARADDADGDLAAVGDQHARGARAGSLAIGHPGRAPLLEERAHAFLAFRRDALPRRSSPRSGSATSAGGRPATCAISRFARGDGARRGRQQLAARSRRSSRSRSASAPTACTRPISRARAARESRAGQEQLARRRHADLRDDERRDHRRQDAELHLGEAEHRVVGGHDDVADGGEAGAAAERGAVDAADRAAPAACRARRTSRPSRGRRATFSSCE